MPRFLFGKIRRKRLYARFKPSELAMPEDFKKAVTKMRDRLWPKKNLNEITWSLVSNRSKTLKTAVSNIAKQTGRSPAQEFYLLTELTADRRLGTDRMKNKNALIAALTAANKANREMQYFYAITGLKKPHSELRWNDLREIDRGLFHSLRKKTAAVKRMAAAQLLLGQRPQEYRGELSTSNMRVLRLRVLDEILWNRGWPGAYSKRTNNALGRVGRRNVYDHLRKQAPSVSEIPRLLQIPSLLLGKNFKAMEIQGSKEAPIVVYTGAAASPSRKKRAIRHALRAIKRVFPEQWEVTPKSDWGALEFNLIVKPTGRVYKTETKLRSLTKTLLEWKRLKPEELSAQAQGLQPSISPEVLIDKQEKSSDHILTVYQRTRDYLNKIAGTNFEPFPVKAIPSIEETRKKLAGAGITPEKFEEDLKKERFTLQSPVTRYKIMLVSDHSALASDKAKSHDRFLKMLTMRDLNAGEVEPNMQKFYDGLAIFSRMIKNNANRQNSG